MQRRARGKIQRRAPGTRDTLRGKLRGLVTREDAGIYGAIFRPHLVWVDIVRRGRLQDIVTRCVHECSKHVARWEGTRGGKFRSQSVQPKGQGLRNSTRAGHESCVINGGAGQQQGRREKWGESEARKSSRKVRHRECAPRPRAQEDIAIMAAATCHEAGARHGDDLAAEARGAAR